MIPEWTESGVLPPVDASNPVSQARSPYSATMLDLAVRFGTTVERRALLADLLRYREQLRAAGIVDGFHWIDGSFIEHVELLEGRAPGDLDVVTFYRQTEAFAPSDLAALTGLAKRRRENDALRIHGFLVSLDRDGTTIVRQTAYWYSLWSHRRTGLWRGFVEVSLDEADDEAAARHLEISMEPADES